MKTIIFDESNITDVAQQLVALMPECRIFTFNGPLGAGKTTLIRSMLKECGVTQAITSPTFTYLNVYENQKGQLFYHFDLYRLASLEEFQAAGFDEYLYQSHSWAFIEWPAVIMPLLKEKVCHITLDYGANHTERILTYQGSI